MNETRALLGKLRQLTNLIQRARSQEITGHDFNMMDGKGRLLSVLQTKDGLTQRELAHELGIRPPSVGELIRKLEAKGLVERQNSEIDRRVMNVFLTDTGRKVISSASVVQEGMQQSVFQDISEEERESFTLVLDKMIISLEEKYADDENEPRKGCGRGRCRGGRGEGKGRGKKGAGRGQSRRQNRAL